MNLDSLPFQRGMTASNGISGVPASGSGTVSVLPTANGLLYAANQYRPDLADKVVDIYSDTKFGDPKGNRHLRLRCVQAAAAITVARKLVTFSTSAYLFGVATTSPAIPSSGSAGLCALAIDHAYTVGQVIPAFDWFWCIEEGIATVIVGTTTTAIHQSLMCDANGLLAPATAGLAVVGTGDQTVTADGSSTAHVWMRGIYNQVSDL